MPSSRLVEDIPVARRSRRNPGRRPASPWRRLAWLLLASGLFSASTVPLLRGPLRSLISPPPVAGLNARLSSDGRLLGHFPYPETAASALVALPGGDHRLRPEAAAALTAMRQAAAADGIDLVVLSAFRPLAVQRSLFFEVMAERNQSPKARAQVSAPPGFSEHSTGYAVDLGDGTAPATDLAPSFEATPAFHWLVRHGARFHFQMSFPRGNPQGVSYEPWHWRFEGSTEALRLFQPALSLTR